MEPKQSILTRTWVVAALACVCCILWGSAIPTIKTGYRLLQVDSADTASQIVFAGVRFTLAGLLVLLFTSLKEKKAMLPDRQTLTCAVPACLAQTFVQYFFFYIGVAHTSGVKGGIITGLGNFIAILFSCLLFRKEKMTVPKLIGCILGFAGVVIINLMGNSLDMGFNLTGEGFVLISQMSYGMSTVLISIYSKKISRCLKRYPVYYGRNSSICDRHTDGRTLRAYNLCKQPSDSVSCSGICCRLHLMVRPAHL